MRGTMGASGVTAGGGRGVTAADAGIPVDAIISDEEENNSGTDTRTEKVSTITLTGRLYVTAMDKEGIRLFGARHANRPPSTRGQRPRQRRSRLAIIYT